MVVASLFSLDRSFGCCGAVVAVIRDQKIPKGKMDPSHTSSVRPRRTIHTRKPIDRKQPLYIHISLDDTQSRIAAVSTFLFYYYSYIQRMAVGPLARLLAQVIVPVVAVVARALPAAYAQALANARRSGAGAAASQAANAQAPWSTRVMDLSEARQILNVTEEQAQNDPSIIERQYEKYMAANAVPTDKGQMGGSFYLQSKIYRAREALLARQKEA